MGLFKKSKKPAPSPPSAAVGNVSPTQFYALCVEDYHNRAKQLGYAERNVIFIPELINFGQQAVLWFLRNDELQRQFSSPNEYYYVAVNTAIRCGIIFGLKWHLDFEGLNRPGYVQSVMESGPSGLSADIIKEDLGMDEKAFGSFCVEIFLRWSAVHEPYWNLQDPRDYTVYATLAAFQLGVSMILCKYGF